MSSMQQCAELQRQILEIANDVCGLFDDWDFKQYVLGTLFYHSTTTRSLSDLADRSEKKSGLS